MNKETAEFYIREGYKAGIARAKQKVEEQWGRYGNGCGCCGDSTVTEEIDKVLTALDAELSYITKE